MFNCRIKKYLDESSPDVNVWMPEVDLGAQPPLYSDKYSKMLSLSMLSLSVASTNIITHL